MAELQFHELLKDILDGRVRSQGELAEHLDYTQGYVSKILTGRMDPSEGFILRLWKRLELPHEEVFALLTAAHITVPPELRSEASVAMIEAESAVNSALHDATIPAEIKQHMIADLQSVVDGWRAYLKIQQLNRHRDWTMSNRLASQQLEDVDRLYLRLSSYLKLASVRAQSHLGDAEKAQRSLERLIASGAKLDDLQLQTLGYLYQGNTYRDIGRWRDAVAEYERAQEIYDRLGDRISSHEVEMSIAIAYLFGGEYDRALTSLHRCLNVFKADELAALMVRAHYALAWAYNLCGEWDRSFQHHQDGLKIACDELPQEDRGTKYLIMLGRSFLGNDYRQRREPEKALVEYTDAHHMVKEFGDTREYGWILMGLARVQGQLALKARANGTREEATTHYDKAVGYFEQALTFNFQIGFWYRQSMAQTHYGRFLLDYDGDKHTLTQATELLREAISHADTAHSQYYKAQACVWLCECYRRHQENEQFESYVRDVEASREIAQYDRLLARLRLIQAHSVLDHEELSDEDLAAAVPYLVDAFDCAIRHHSLTATEMQNRLGRIITNDLRLSCQPDQLHRFVCDIAEQLQKRFDERRHFDENQRNLRADAMTWLRQTADIVLQRGMIEVEPFD